MLNQLNQKQEIYGNSENSLFSEEECKRLRKENSDDRVKTATSLLLFTDRGDVGNFIHLPVEFIYGSK